MKLELYYFDECPYCQRVLKKIKELNLTQIDLKNILTSKESAEFHFKTTGKRTVPCLYVDGRPMFESSEINRWLEQHQTEIG